MKTCKRLLNWIQIINAEGDVRLCSWSRNNTIGNLLDDDMRNIINGEKAAILRKMIAEGDFSNCPEDNCPYLANGKIEDILVEYDEDAELQPETLHLAFEGNCNYDCTCCTSYQHMIDTRQHDYRDYYDQLEEGIRSVLPYIKHIGANGRGELFASPRILRLLAEWNPIAPTDECSVMLETNGSLFNETNWKRIENLGKYDLSVAITVMSFDEPTYQFLSGTALPISKLEDNLRFVKTLRDKGIINYLELATVMQELNFREMPDFTRRCIEEFGADKVRIRPVVPGGRFNQDIQWFMNVRNPLHPYYSLYTAVMKDPIFADEHVLLWSGDLDSASRNSYGREQGEVSDRIRRLLNDENVVNRICKITDKNAIGLFGLGMIGKILVHVMKDQGVIHQIYDRSFNNETFMGIPVHRVNEAMSFDGTIIVTPYGRFDEMKTELESVGFTGDIINIDSLLF